MILLFTPINKTWKEKLFFLLKVESAPVSPSRSLQNANSVPNLPQTSSSTASGTLTPTPKTATPTNYLSTPKGNVGKKNSLTSSLTNMMAQLDNSIRGNNIATTPTSEEDLLSGRYVKSKKLIKHCKIFREINLQRNLLVKQLI